MCTIGSAIPGRPTCCGSRSRPSPAQSAAGKPSTPWGRRATRPRQSSTFGPWANSHAFLALRRHHHRLRRGRRHPVPPAGALRQADPAARARRLRAEGAGQLEHQGGQRGGEVPDQGALAGQGREGPASAHQLLGGRQHEVLRRRAVPAPAGGLRRAQAPWRRLAGVADRLRRARALLHRSRAPLPGARPARRGSDRSARQRALRLPRRESRAANPAAERRLRAARPASLSRAARDHARRIEPAAEPLHPLRHLRRPSLPGPGQVGRPGGLRGSGAASTPT